jgi:hypothetical protein
VKPDPGRLFAPPGSAARPFAEGLAWLWRLGPVADEPRPSDVGLGAAADARALGELVRQESLRAALVLAAGEEEEAGVAVPGSRVVEGVATFPHGRVQGRHTVFLEGRSVLRSGLGDHAVADGGVVYLGASPEDWGSVSAYWLFVLLAELLPRELGRPLIALPQLGCIRLDDSPGTAQQQLLGRDHPDRVMARRLDGYARSYRRSGAVLVVAVASAALREGRPVPLQEVWPAATEAVRRGVEAGVFEVACHGTLHLDREALAAGEVEPREFLRLSEEEAGRRLDEALSWARAALGEPASFVAPAWGYSSGTLAAAAERGLPTWCPPDPGPLLRGWQLHETTKESLRGLDRLDYRPLAALAGAGLPPTPVLHGRLLDNRPTPLRTPRDALDLARLVVRQDITRIPAVRGVRWVGVRELVAALRAHGETELGADGASAVGPGSSRLLA